MKSKRKKKNKVDGSFQNGFFVVFTGSRFAAMTRVKFSFDVRGTIPEVNEGEKKGENRKREKKSGQRGKNTKDPKFTIKKGFRNKGSKSKKLIKWFIKVYICSSFSWERTRLI